MIPRISLLTAAAILTLVGGSSYAYAGFEWTPPAAAKQGAPAAVPEVEAEPLAPADMVAPEAETPAVQVQPNGNASTPSQNFTGMPAVSAPAMAATPEAAQEPVLKVKRLAPEEMPALSSPPTGMEMPENPALTTSPPAMPRTVSVPPEMDAPDAAPSQILPSGSPSVSPSPAGGQPEKEEKKGLSINPFPIQNAPAKSSQSAQMADKSPVQPSTQATERYEEVMGFGSDMPLALALRQIVPPQYAFSFAKGVNPGYRVSWNGGAPWNEVVQSMIAPLNLVSEIRGHTLVIKPASASGQDLSSFAPMAPPAEKISDKTAAAGTPPAVPASVPVMDASGDVLQNSIETAAGTEKEVRSAEKELLAGNKPGTVKLTNAAPTSQGINHARIWEAKQGDSLKDILTHWSQEASVDLVWNAAHDYELSSGVLVNGTFGSALTVLFMHGLEPGTAPGHRIAEDGGASSLIIEDPAS